MDAAAHSSEAVHTGEGQLSGDSGVQVSGTHIPCKQALCKATSHATPRQSRVITMVTALVELTDMAAGR